MHLRILNSFTLHGELTHRCSRLLLLLVLVLVLVLLVVVVVVLVLVLLLLLLELLVLLLAFYLMLAQGLLSIAVCRRGCVQWTQIKMSGFSNRCVFRVQCSSMSPLRALRSQYSESCMPQWTALENNDFNSERNAKAKGTKMHFPAKHSAAVFVFVRRGAVKIWILGACDAAASIVGPGLHLHPRVAHHALDGPEGDWTVLATLFLPVVE